MKDHNKDISGSIQDLLERFRMKELEKSGLSNSEREAAAKKYAGLVKHSHEYVEYPDHVTGIFVRLSPFVGEYAIPFDEEYLAPSFGSVSFDVTFSLIEDCFYCRFVDDFVSFGDEVLNTYRNLSTPRPNIPPYLPIHTERFLEGALGKTEMLVKHFGLFVKHRRDRFISMHGSIPNLPGGQS